MSGVEATGPAGAVPSDAGTSDGTADAQIQQAFAQGLAHFMVSMMESFEGDIQQACDDTTSDPDAPA